MVDTTRKTVTVLVEADVRVVVELSSAKTPTNGSSIAAATVEKRMIIELLMFG